MCKHNICFVTRYRCNRMKQYLTFLLLLFRTENNITSVPYMYISINVYVHSGSNFINFANPSDDILSCTAKRSNKSNINKEKIEKSTARKIRFVVENLFSHLRVKRLDA